MTKIRVTERERYALYLVLFNMPQSDRSARLRTDRLVTLLKLDDMSDQVDTTVMTKKNVTHADFGNDLDDVSTIEVEMNVDQKEYLAQLLNTPYNTALGQILKRFDAEICKAE